MGEDTVNTSGWAVTYEGPVVGHGFVLSISLGRTRNGVPAFHEPCPVLTPLQAQAAWLSAQGGSKVAFRASLPPAAQAWFDQLKTTPNPDNPAFLIDLQAAAVYAAASGNQPPAVLTLPGFPPPY
jgi:hypothetical protein